MAQDLLYKPGSSAGAALLLKSKLQGVAVHLVPPDYQDASLKDFQQQ